MVPDTASADGADPRARWRKGPAWPLFHLAGSDYTIADIATYPWVAGFEFRRVDLAEFLKVKRWFDAIGARPAVKRVGVNGPVE